MVLVKWDAEGNLLWNRTWGGPSDDYGSEVWGDDAGNVYTCGETSSSGSGYYMVLVKWDSAGNQLWNRTRGGNASGLWGDDAGNVYTCGSTDRSITGNYDIVLVKWDVAGNQQWSCIWGGSSNEYGHGVWGDGKGNVYTCGESQVNGAFNSDMVLVKWSVAPFLNQAPAITHPADITYSVGYTGSFISWTITDKTTGTCSYMIFRNGTQIANGSWTSGVSVGQRVVDLVPETYNYTIIASDGLGGNVSDAVVVEVTPNYVPAIISEWNRTWDGSPDDHGYGVWGDGSGNVYTCGETYRSGTGHRDMVLVKWDAAGNRLWNRTWGGIYHENANGIWGDSEGNVYTCGQMETLGSGSWDIVLVKWNATGNQVWNRTWDGSPDDHGHGVWGDGSGNVYTCGETYRSGTSYRDMVLVKWDAAGNRLWNRTWGGNAYDGAEKVWGDSAGNIYTCGYTASFGNGGLDMVLVKWDAAGNRQWYRTWGGSSFDFSQDVWGDDAGNIFMCGETQTSSVGGGNYDMVLVKWDAAGNQLWNRTWGGPGIEYGNGMWGDGAGNVYTCGQTSSFGGNDVLLVKWEGSGNQLWNGTWGGSSNDKGYGIWGDGAESIYICGDTYSYGAGHDDIVLVKLSIARLPSQKPSITRPADIIYTVGQIGNVISWTITDTAPGMRNYTIYHDGTSITSGLWINGTPITQTVDNLPLGSHNYTIIATDGLNGSVQDSVIVMVNPNIAPIITCPADITYTSGQIGSTITWTITDTSTGMRSYTIYCNGTLISSGSWTSGVAVAKNVDGIAVGSNNFTIVASDGLGGVVTDGVVVTVLNVPPSITHPADITYTVGQAGHSLSWTITDATTGIRSYTIYRNGSSIASGSWASGVAVAKNVDDLPAGSHNYTIIATDGFGGSVQDTVAVIVIPNEAPCITCTLQSNGTEMSWTITDAGTGTTCYALYRNGDIIVNGTWVPGLVVHASTCGLAPGAYNFTIIATDGLGGLTQGSVLVVVVARGQVDDDPPRDGDPGVPLIAMFGVLAVIGLAMAMLVIKLGIKCRKSTKSAGATRRRLTSDDWIQEATPRDQATVCPAVNEREPVLHCPVCMEDLPPGFGRGRYCGYCGGQLRHPDSP
jgi:hypothetical protein